MSPNAAAKTAPQIDRGNAWMFRYAVALAACVLVSIILGAAITSEIQPVPGSSSPPAAALTQTAATLGRFHMVFSLAVAVLIFGFGVCVRIMGRRVWISLLAWTAFMAVLAEGWWGMQERLSPSAAFFHAVFGHSLLSIFVVLAAGMLPQPDTRSLATQTSGQSLRPLAAIAPILAFLQILLGAAYRHGLTGVMLHILNALIVAIAVLVICMLTARQFPDHAALRQAAVALGIVTGVQVALGFATFIVIIIGLDNTTPLLLLSIAHVTTGALTLATSLVLAAQVWRYVQRRTQAAAASAADRA